jgi:PAP2 superfamily
MKKTMFKTAVFVALLVSTTLIACKKDNHPHQQNYDASVAVSWMNLYLRLTKATPGFNSVVASRAYAYAGLALYESVAPGNKHLKSIMPQLNEAPVMPTVQNEKKYYWPASANAAMANITKKLFGNASPAMITAIDSLEADWNSRFQTKASADEIQVAVEFGKQTSSTIFDWSKTDGGHEAYSNVTSATYVPPTGEGKWVPTAPAFGKPIHPYWGNNRSFIKNIAVETQPAAPIPFSVAGNSDFYKEVKHVFDLSKQLSATDTVTVKFWGDITGNYNAPAHAANIVTQLVQYENLSLYEAAILYCKHGIAYSDALISSFKAKYQYNLLRPITYIRSIMEVSNWNSVIPTPPHPEYASNHAVISSAAAEVLIARFGHNYTFTDGTYAVEYGVRTYAGFKKYAEEAAMSRVLGGIHYRFTALSGMEQGEKVGKRVNQLVFWK